MVRWFKHKALSIADFSHARSWMIFFAIINLVNAALTVAEHQSEGRVPLSVWGSMAISVFSVLAAVYYQRRLDQARAIAGVMREPDSDPS
ncbi:hypothetical protein B1A87_003045 [Arthrobacter sp. KBS0703]|uniref:hypothetical protein n=1 Tax=Arthrobacter sp. KBS0703 TaxID=1955698 RepID=UPI00098EA3CF|nr:hypothetical protein [Arthrobacter sp. KBS0703]TSE15043.1 hypothetical protein B1A87_003045 [Arthrobacter sp. KBS0703]